MSIDPLAMREPDPMLLSQMLRVVQDEDARRADYARAWEAYNGDLPKPLKTNQNSQANQASGTQPDLNVRVNRIRPLVMAGVHFLFGTPPTLTVDGATVEDDETTSDDARWLAQAQAANGWRPMLQDLAINGDLTGTVYVRTDPPGPDHEYPVVTVVDPTTMTIMWDPRNIERVTSYIWQYDAYDQDKKPLTVRQLIERSAAGTWTLIDQHYDKQKQTWVEDLVTEWNFPWSPITHCKNLPAPNSVYGEPGVTPTMIECARARNMVLTLGIKIYYNHGAPIVWIKNAANKIFQSINRILNLPGKDSEIGQLQPEAKPEAGIAIGKELDDSICEEGQTPGMAMGRADDLGNLSGVALRIRMWPLLSKTEARRTLYEPLIIAVCQHMLELGGRGARRRVAAQWPEILPADPLAERNVALIDQQMGVADDQTLAEKLGYSWAVVKPRLEEQRQERADQQAANQQAIAANPVLAVLERRADTRPNVPRT